MSGASSTARTRARPPRRVFLPHSPLRPVRGQRLSASALVRQTTSTARRGTTIFHNPPDLQAASSRPGWNKKHRGPLFRFPASRTGKGRPGSRPAACRKNNSPFFRFCVPCAKAARLPLYFLFKKMRSRVTIRPSPAHSPYRAFFIRACRPCGYPGDAGISAKGKGNA